MRGNKNKYNFKSRRGFKRKKSLLKRGFFWLGILGFLFLAGSTYFFFFSPYFQVKEIMVSGDQDAPLEEVKNIIAKKSIQKFAFWDFKNIVLTNLTGIESLITDKFPKIASITLTKQFPDVLAAQIEERKPVAILCEEGDCFFVDIKGVIFEKASPYSSDYPVLRNENQEFEFKLGKQAIEKEKIEDALKIDQSIRKNSKIGLSEILFVSQRKINVKTTEGWLAYLNPSKDLDSQLGKLEIVLKDKSDPKKRTSIEYIDLRFDKIYIFPEGI